MKFMLIVVAAVLAVVVSAEKRGNHRTVPSYRSGSGSYEKQYETTTYATLTYNTAASYQYPETETTYEDEPVYTKSYSRPSYKTTPTPYVTESASYSKSSYEPSTYSSPSSTYVTTKPKSYEATEPVRSYSSKPTYSESPYSSSVYMTTTSAPYASSQRYSTPGYYSKQDSYDYKPMPYKFAWGVKDEKSYNDYSHQEESDGKVVSGSYRVLLPDGRTQIVTYKADEYGYQAEVKYEGEAKYDEYKPTYKPAYSKPADVKYEEGSKYTNDYKPADYMKGPVNYSAVENAAYTKKTAYTVPVYSTKPYEATTAYTIPSYQSYQSTAY